MQNSTKNHFTLLIIALLAIIAFLLAAIAFKEEPAPIPQAQSPSQTQVNPTPQVDTPATQTQVASIDPTVNSPQRPQTPLPDAPSQTDEVTIDDIAVVFIKGARIGADEQMIKALSEIPSSEYGNLVRSIDNQDPGMGAGFMDWLYRSNLKKEATSTYSQLDLAYQAKLLEVFVRNDLKEVAKFYYSSQKPLDQQHIRQQIRSDYPKKYSTVMRGVQ